MSLNHGPNGSKVKKKALSVILISCIVVASVLAGIMGIINSQNNSQDTGSITFSKSWLAGTYDTNDQLMSGTEITFLVPHKQKLYAGNSLWMESSIQISKRSQIFVKESIESDWKIDYQFSGTNLRVTSLKSITFTTDRNGSLIDPISILLASASDYTGLVAVYGRDDYTGTWIKTSLGQSTSSNAQIRFIGFHRDNITGIDRVFAGSSPLGIYSGVYDPTLPGKIDWDESPEFVPSGDDRVMGMTVCNGVFYCSTSRSIYVRTDGFSPSWVEVFTYPDTIKEIGIRGLTTVPNPSGEDQVLLFAVGNKVRRLVPSNNYEEIIELDQNAFLSSEWGLKVDYVLSAYNDFMPFFDPLINETILLFGFQAKYHRSVFENGTAPDVKVFSDPGKSLYYDAGGRYFVRHDIDGIISYEIVEVMDPQLDPEPKLVSIRTIVPSPFPEEEGNVLYLGGFDCNFIRAHNTGWIYRAEYPS